MPTSTRSSEGTKHSSSIDFYLLSRTRPTSRSVPRQRSERADKRAAANPQAKSKVPISTLPTSAPSDNEIGAIDKEYYKKELFRLQLELVKLHEWIKFKGLKVVVLFEGRAAAGRGGVIKRITQHLSTRICRVVALPAPTKRERT